MTVPVSHLKGIDQNTAKALQGLGVKDSDQMMIITRDGIVIRCPLAQVSVIGRNTQGVRLINLDSDDVVVDVAHLAVEDEETK